ncbi:hypothetical protein L914_20701 [Phytophthora nicotianae]|uniref:RxLR effector protein n=1 Tax=Phytophthora nicotianae TaxID=4792 RepID=W2M8C1_PHYNI|nr:hypothetical protein L914_20701 [Phytophthora nicotianae]
MLILLAVCALLTRADPASSVSIPSSQASSSAFVPIHRYLRKHTRATFDGDHVAFEDRTNGIKLPAMIKNLIKSSGQTLTKLATTSKSDKQETIENLFQSLNVGAVEGKLFESAPYQAWASSVSNIYKKKPELGQETMFRTLVAHYGDESLAKLLAQARQDSTTKIIAEQFENIQFNKWIVQRKTADDIYGLLKLDDEVDNVFMNPSIGTWVSYVSRLDTVDPYKWLAVKLTTRYGEDGLARMVTVAKRRGNYLDKHTANRVEFAQIKSWVNDGKTLDDVFILLRLDRENVLNNPALDTWIFFAKRLDKENPYMSMFSAMKKRYGTDVALDFWRVEKITADQAFNYLGLRIGDELFKNPHLNTWVSYVNKLNKYERSPDEFAVVSMLEERFGDGMDLARKLYAAEKVATVTEDTITSLRTLQFKKWSEAAWVPNYVAQMLRKRDDVSNGSIMGEYLSFYDKYWENFFKTWWGKRR